VLFQVTHPPDPRPVLVVETTAHIDEGVIEGLKQRMLGMGCSNGLLFDADECLILRDTYTSLEVDSLQVDARVSTARLLARMPGPDVPMDQRVLHWLHSMAASWDTALPPDPDVTAHFITDIVPAVSGSDIHEVARPGAR